RDGFARDFEGEMQTASGRRRHVLISVERMELEGRPCVLTLIHDLTERVQLEEQLRHSQKMEAIGRLAGGIAHDFNNLLTALSGYNALVIEGLREADPLRAYAMRVSQAAARASALTRQLLAFSRKQPSAPVELDLNALLSGTITMLRPLIGEDIEVSCALDPALGAVRADPTQLEQVIANLVINARDAMPKGGRLTIETANLDEGGAWVRLSVRDTGTGIDDAARARLFEPFFTTKEPGKGTGLGLALVYGIVEQCGGRVLVDSQPGQGALFEVRLPRLSAQAPKAAEASGPVLLPRGHETILLVEDDESVRELVQFVLAQKGYQVLVAEDGRDALAQATAHPGPIDLLISDVVMPHLDGSELAARLRELRRETRVLHISGYPGDTIERHGPLGPPNAFLAKPFSREALLARVRAILDEKR
ncbi:MAG: ATP-binding protein, partial [Polyangia bacterium]